MKKQLNVTHLHEFLDHARGEFVALAPHARILGMEKNLSESERLALCYIRAAVTLFNKQEALVNGAVEALDVQLEQEVL